VSENEQNYMWFTTWELVLKDKNLSIGGIGLTGLPDKRGETIVGYGLDATFHNRGFATEALEGLANWVFQHPRAEYLVAETEKENYPSHQVLKKNGFVQTDIRGELLIWKLPKSLRRMNQEIINEAACQKN
jgi:RimJ/RimL family protein N-acetyltransferase